MLNLKKIASFTLVALVIIFTVIAILAIWDFIPFEDVMKKILTTLFVIFVASVVVLFIFSVLIREPETPKQQ